VSSTALGLPTRLEDTLNKLEQGDLRMRVRSVETDRAIRRLSSVNMGTNYALLTGAFTLAGTILLVNQFIWFAIIPGILAVVSGGAFIRVLVKMDRYERMF
jgi:hypothetical protein